MPQHRPQVIGSLPERSLMKELLQTQCGTLHEHAALVSFNLLGCARDQSAHAVCTRGHGFLGSVEGTLDFAAAHRVVDRVGDIAQGLLHVRLSHLDETGARRYFASVLHTAAGRIVGAGGCRTHLLGRCPLGGIDDVIRFDGILCSAHVPIVVEPARQVNSNIGLDHEFPGRDHRPQRRAVARHE